MKVDSRREGKIPIILRLSLRLKIKILELIEFKIIRERKSSIFR